MKKVAVVIFIVATLFISIAPVFGVTGGLSEEVAQGQVAAQCLDCNAKNPSGAAPTEEKHVAKPTGLIQGLRVLVLGTTGSSLDDDEANRIAELGADVTLVEDSAISSLTLSDLESYDVVYLALPWGLASNYIEGIGDILQTYVYNGGGLVVGQCNDFVPPYTPSFLPYSLTYVDTWYPECGVTILDPDHYITAGLTGDEMPDVYDRVPVDSLDPHYEVLAVSSWEDVISLAVAEYGNGRIVVHTSNWKGTGTVCGDDPDVIIERIFYWAAHGTPPTPVNATWTFMVYLDGDNNLDSAALDDLSEMESVGSTDNVNIVVLLDRYYEGAKVYYVEQGYSTEVADCGEVNMGDPQTLIDFVNYVVNNYPAEHYALILWNHGAGWKNESILTKGVIYDDTNYDYLTMDELEYALQQMEPMDIVGFDACLMGMAEVDYTIYNAMPNAIRVGSEECEPWDGWPYDMILSDLTSNPAMTPEELATTIVNDYVASYGTYSEVTQSAVYVNSNVYSALNDFVDAVMTANDQDAVAQAMLDVERMYCWDEYADLYHFVSLVASYSSDSNVQTQANNLMNVIDNAVIAEAHGSYHTNVYGISIYLPYSSIDPEYYSISFAEDNLWDEFLDWAVYYTPPEPQWTEIISDTVGDSWLDIIGVDKNLTASDVSYRVRFNQPITNADEVSAVTWLDTDQNPETGASGWWINYGAQGAEYAVVVYYWSGYYNHAIDKEKDKDMKVIKDLKDIFNVSVKQGIYGSLYRWDESYQEFEWVADIPVYLNNTYFWYSVPLGLLEDEGEMDVVEYVEYWYNYYTYHEYDFAPDIVIPPYAVLAMVVYNGDLYVGVMSGQNIGQVYRIESVEGGLYAGTSNPGKVYEYDGTEWYEITDWTLVGDNLDYQVSSLIVYLSLIHISEPTRPY